MYVCFFVLDIAPKENVAFSKQHLKFLAVVVIYYLVNLRFCVAVLIRLINYLRPLLLKFDMLNTSDVIVFMRMMYSNVAMQLDGRGLQV